ncbi:MAG TPA: hypothetical protein VF109_05250, partial [Mycobacteriales bacterium]
PVAADPVAANPVAANPVAVSPGAAGLAADPVAANPAAANSPAVSPVAAKPVAADPVAAGLAADPVAANPVAANPAAVSPVAANSVAADPTASPAGPGRAPEREGVPLPAGDREAPGDAPGGAFELVAANLEWVFDAGSPDPDAADAALQRYAAAGGRTAALFRTWVRDPSDGWIRVVLGYVGPRGSIADVEAERTAVVETLQRAGAARCCVEVLAATEAGDVHRWLEERCHPLWPEHKEPREHRPLPPDARFAPGPGPDDPFVAELIAWAAARSGVVGLVTAYADGELVAGVAVEAGVDPASIPGRDGVRIEPFAPSRGLDPVHLRLTRSATRVWTRRAERAASPEQPPARGPARPEAPRVVELGPPPVRDTDEARGDESVGGFTLVGIDRETEIAKGAPEPDERDTLLVEWARAQPTVIALLRAYATVQDETIPVYCVAITETTDPNAARRSLADAVAATGTPKAAAEAFAPAGDIPAFHLDLAVGSTRLWMGTSG